MANTEQLVAYLKQVTGDLQEARRRVAELEDAADGPIAVVGMGCRFPGGADSPERLWDLVDTGVDAISDFPADRGWQTAHLGDGVRKQGGFLYDAAEFDPAFFGISPHEALAMDPQQRLVLETAWEALENAGIDPETLRGTATGVFVGAANQHYGLADAEALQLVRGHVLTGGTTSVASGRLAYVLGLEGPAVTVDTACSSALVALHLAVRSLRAGESTFAFAAGAAVMADPGLFAEFAQQGGLAGDGRCKSFAANADGTGWSEGAGVLALCRLEDAQRLGHPVLAVIAGSAVNSDGASNGLTAPNGPSQQRVIRAALQDAGLGPGQIDVVEAHGTGTRLGDPVEAQALIATYGAARTAAEPLWLGSVKSNIGHSQAAAGMAGVIKMVQAMRHGTLPRTLHADEPTTQVDWTTGTVRLLTEARPWPRTGRPRRAAVSAFGISGTNAHVVLEQAPDSADTAAVPSVRLSGEGQALPIGGDEVAGSAAQVPAGTPVPLPPGYRLPFVFSARGEDALRGQARRLAALLDQRSGTELADLATSLVTTRARLTDRAVVVADGAEDLRSALASVAEGRPDPRVRRGRAGSPGGLAFLFTGQGSQRAGTGAELAELDPVFAAAFDEVCAAFGGELGEPLRPLAFGSPGAGPLDDTRYAQPVLFALEVALFRVLEHWGVHPDFLLGHSIGELSAAHVAGVLSLPDAARLVAARGRLMSALPVGGAMVAVEAAEARMLELLAAEGGGEPVSIAAVNGPESVVLSGAEDAVLRLAGLAAAQGLRTRRLRVSHAFHSPLMEPMLAEFRAVAETLAFRSPRIPIVSGVTGRPLADELCRADYWVTHAREAVRFHDGVRFLAEAGVSAFLELGPGGVLTAMARDCLGDSVALTEATLVRDQAEQASLLSAVAGLHVHGSEVDWSTVVGRAGGRRVALPTYAFQRRRYWLPAHQPDVSGTPAAGRGIRYREAWVPITRDDGHLAGTWVAVLPRDGRGLPAVTGVLDALGRRAERLVRVDGADGLGEALQAPAAGVLSLLALAPDTEPLGPTSAVLEALDSAGADIPLWIITASAVVATADDRAVEPGQASLTGVLRGRGGLVDLPPVAGRRDAELLVSLLADPRGEDEVAVRAAGLFGRRLLPAGAPSGADPFGRAGGTVLVTGDLGGFTPDVLGRLRADGPRRVLLALRPGAEVPAGLPEDVEVAPWPTGAPRPPALDTDPVHVVLHLENLSPDGSARPGPDEVAERTALAELAATWPGLDAFLVFSTVAGIWGGAGDPRHLAAHTRLAALVHRRRLAGQPACLVAWGPFAGSGERAGAAGLVPMEPARALGEINAAGDAVQVIADVDWPAFHPTFAALRPRPLVSLLDEVRALPAAPAPRPGPLTGLPAGELDGRLLTVVRTAAALVLGHPSADAVPPESRFQELGFDSLLAVRFRDALAEATGLAVPATVGYDHPTPLAVATFLGDLVRGADSADGADERPTPAVHSGDPIAVVAMACRYPGGVTAPEQLWDLVSDGRDAIGPFPADRGWDLRELRQAGDAEAGRALPLKGGFLAGAAEFDAAFFGISPREATAMDPQQRVLLEVCWESLERAGLDAGALRGSRTGVFVGVAGSDYQGVLDRATGADGHAMTGTASSVVSGRVSYTFGFEGPALTVDTACSSSLVAIHLAARALRAGECDLALAGGVTVMNTPGGFLEFARQGGLAPDGRCKSFAATADGTGWSEGAGVLVLQRLSDARRDGNRVLAVIAGSALNSDGASNGLTAPNGPAQQRVIRAALADAGLRPSDVDAVEAHGTGTVLGDPIEAQALLATYGRARADEQPLWLGSLKSNIGHTMAAAGVGGVIKMILAMRHGHLPATLHVDQPTGKVDWTAGAVRLLTETRSWPETGRPRRAGVSSFGMSGTNAHLVLAQPDPEPAADPVSDTATPDAPETVLPWVLSARSPEALAGLAGRLTEEVAGGALADVPPALLGRALLDSRTRLEHRAVVLGRDRAQLLDRLARLAVEPEPAGVVRGVALPPVRGHVWVFPGQGGQWAGMAAALLESSPVFAVRWAECERALAPYLERSLTELAAADEGYLAGGRVDVVQPALFAMMVSLAEVWQSFGVEPAAVVGHSQGEIAAACVAGVLSLEDAAKVVALRAKALTALAGAGGMISLAAPVDVVAELVGAWSGRASVAAVNGPAAVVVSGEPAALAEILAEAGERGIRNRRIDVDYASHSAQVEVIRDEVESVLAGIRPRQGTVPFFSTVTGEWLDGTTADAAYWYRNLRAQVRFHEAVETLMAEGFRSFVEVSPHPVLGVAITEAADLAELETAVAGTLRRDDGGLERMLTSVAEVFVAGAPADFSPVLPAAARPLPELPTYPFQRRRFWPEGAPATATGDPEDARFWELVDGLDAEKMAGTLGLADTAPLSEVLPALSSWRRGRRDQAALDSWRYAETWQPLPPAAVRGGRWLVVVPDRLAADPAVTVVLRAVPDHVLVPVGAEDVRTGGEGPGGEEHGGEEHGGEGNTAAGALTERLRTALADPAITGILSLTALDTGAHPADDVVPAGLALTLALVQALVDLGAGVPLWCCTDGAVGVPGDGGPRRPEQAAAWALGRVAALEHPKLWGGLIDLPRHLDQPVIDGLAAALCREDGEDQLALREDGLYGRRLTHGDGGRVTGGGWRPSGTVLVTGGTGALGLRVARALAAGGAGHLVLISRSGDAAPGVADLVAELAGAHGVGVTVAACDTADRTEVAAVLDRVQRDSGPVTAVVHAAGAGVLGPLAEASFADLRTVLGAKVAGIENVEAALETARLEAVVYFSSITAVWGAGDHGAYAAANAVLDARAQRRTADGVPTLSVAWGPWAGGGMVADEIHDTLRRRGLPVLDPDLAVAGLLRLLAEGSGAAILAEVDWARFVPVFTSGRASRLLDALPEAQPEPEVAETGPVAGNTTLRRLSELDESQRVRALRELVREHTAAVLGHPDAAAVEPRRAFSDAGLDSLTAVELRDRLTKATEVRLPTTVVFDHPTPVALAAFLDRLAFGARTTAAAPGPARIVAKPETADPIAIVAMSCRFPGGIDSPEQLWQAVSGEADLITPFPADRGWPLGSLFDPDPDAPGTSYVDHAGFLRDATMFDPEFFGISPREAVAMDPQQRVLLETAWEVLERAGIDPKSLRGSRTGVYVGTTDQAYGGRLTAPGAGMEGYLATGGSTSVASGRISYLFGFEGPAVSIDTACSASLVALHLAAGSLRSGESDLALAGGVMVMSDPTSFVAFSRQRALAADGRCKSFAAAADGFTLAEGAGLLLLERLSDARRHGHEVLGLVRGSAINSDGASNGLTAPNGPSQERVILGALADAGLEPSEVDAVEAHGTGTRLGDPIEAQALLATYGRAHSAEAPLWVGSVKSNIGHTQHAAGAAGIIKMVMAMRHATLPRTLHVDAPSPHVDWSAGAVELLTEARPWPETGRPRRFGVSSFGISGTNAHVVLEQAPAAEPEPAPDPVAEPGPLPVVVSARSRAALAEQAARFSALVTADPALPPADLAFSSLTSRAVLDHSAVLVAEDRDELLAGLARLATPDGSDVIRERSAEGELAVVFAGQGAQRTGMGSVLYQRFPVFARALDEVCAQLDRHLRRPLRNVMFAKAGTEDAALLDRTEYAQCALFAFEVALFRLLEQWGVRPDALLGHSIGELTAAHLAGVWTLEDAARVVAARGRLMQELPAGGAMIAVAAAEPVVRECLAGLAGQATIAAVNGPEAVVVSGAEDAVLAVAATLAERGARTRRLAVSHAFHSPLMEPMLAEFAGILAGVEAADPAVVVISDVTGEPVKAGQLADPAYWVDQVRREVRFADGVRTLVSRGVTTFLEAGPGAELTAAVLSVVEEPVGALACLRRDGDEVRALFTTLGRLHARGVAVDVPAVFEGTGARRVELPTYAFQRRRFWLQRDHATTDPASAGLAATGHPVFTTRADLPGGARLYHGRVTGAGEADLTAAALWVAADLGCARIDRLGAHRPVPAGADLAVQLRVSAPESDGRRELTVHHRLAATPEQAWEHTIIATLRPAAGEPSFDLSAWPPAGALELDGTGGTAVWAAAADLYAEVRLESGAGEADTLGVLAPDLLAALDTLVPQADRARGGQGRRIRAWHGVTLVATGAETLRVHLTPSDPDGLTLRLADPAGRPVAVAERLELGDPAPVRPTVAGAALHRLDWVPAGPAAELDVSWAVLGGHDGVDFARALGSQPGRQIRSWPDLAALREDLGTGRTDAVAPDLLVVVVEPPVRGLADAAHHSAEEVLELVRALVAEEHLAGTRFVTLTRGATGAATSARPAAAAGWGLLLSAQAEYPDRFVLVDLDDWAGDAEQVPAAVAVALATGEQQLAIRAGEVLVPRLAVEVPGPDTEPWPAGTVLVTGATGAIGEVIARHLAAAGAERLLLLSRGGPGAPGADRLVADLATHGTVAEVVACDVGDRDALAAVLDDIPAEFPLSAVVHVAGVVDDGTLTALTPARLHAVLRPKVDAAVNLHELTAGLDLARFVLFSSAVGTLGAAGQANYAAGNAFLDALARQRRAAGLPGTSLAWGLWGTGGGMSGGLDEVDRRRMARAGVVPLTEDAGRGLFEAAWASGEAVLLPMHLDLGVLRGNARSGTLPAALRGLVPAPLRRAATAEVAQLPFAERLAGLSAQRRAEELLDVVRRQVAAVLSLGDPAGVDERKQFRDLGFDSLTAIELRNALTAATDLPLSAAVVFDYPTPAELAAHLEAGLRKAEPGGPPPVVATQLDQLEATVAGLAADDRERSRIAERLKALVLACEQADQSTSDVSVEARLDTASDEEIFDFIRTELGRDR
ncbi:type I polyketide synthase [Amycolatopsis sp. NPDC050768]|uniref:type I polyketide synthase n=1 Tax=Amycolatopsis sp. NPDC050768 TaxID=3154839 RepID=UPI00340A28DB